jgi:hypothetical protein
MSDMIQARNGEKILLEEYPQGFMDDLNARLNRIAGDHTPDPIEGALVRQTPEPFDRWLTVAGDSILAGALVLAVVVGAVQLAMRLT